MPSTTKRGGQVAIVGISRRANHITTRRGRWRERVAGGRDRSPARPPPPGRQRQSRRLGGGGAHAEDHKARGQVGSLDGGAGRVIIIVVVAPARITQGDSGRTGSIDRGGGGGGDGQKSRMEDRAPPDPDSVHPS